MNAVPDKSFMQIPRKEKFYDNRYAEGVDAFLNYAEQDVNRSLTGRLYCRCIKCKNFKLLDRATVREHLIRWHFLASTSNRRRQLSGALSLVKFDLGELRSSSLLCYCSYRAYVYFVVI